MVGTQVVMVVHTWPDLYAETGEEIKSPASPLTTTACCSLGRPTAMFES